LAKAALYTLNGLSPSETSSPSQTCDGTYKLSQSILAASGFVQSELPEIFGVLRSKGGCCHCEILYNVAGSSRLKAQYWRSKAEGLENPKKHLDG
jgi:hypothetical protein